MSQNLVQTAQIINSAPFSGPAQMACDAMMLENIRRRTEISLSVRFYNWKGIWLSIGHHQKKLPQKWIDLAKEKKLSIVRRPSGGSAVLHAGGLTYSLAWQSPPRKKRQAYEEASQWLIESFAALNCPLKFGTEKSISPTGNCFSSSSIADLIDSQGNKRIGSAQYWQGGNLLQHGEILLDPPIDLWREVFNTPPPQAAPNNVPRSGLIDYLTKYCVSYWSRFNWIQNELGENELENIFRNSKSYFIKLSDKEK